MAYWKLSAIAPQYDHTGWCEQTGLTCHDTLMKFVKRLDANSLEFVRRDCLEAAESGFRKSGHYADTALYIAQRLAKR